MNLIFLIAASVKLAPGKTLDFEDPIYAGLPPVLRFTFTASDGCLTSTKSELRVQIQDINEDPVMRKGNKYSATFYEVRMERKLMAI